MVVNNIKGVVIRANRIIDHPTENLISQKHLGNLHMILREKTQISTTIDVHNMNRVKPVSGSSIPNCYICRKDGHYENQCQTRDKGKAPIVNMVVPEIQQVTTRSKGKQ